MRGGYLALMLVIAGVRFLVWAESCATGIYGVDCIMSLARVGRMDLWMW